MAAAQRSDDALAKAARKHTTENTPVHSFTSLIADLATICANHIQPAGVHEGTLGNWVAKDRAEREGTEGLSMGDAAELKRLRAENAQLRMERDVLKRSVVLWVKEATK